ncbi:hypothetical protein CDD82_7626 [Ophiocordyceps australis]|uniref:Zn(2)-C6 fungal-type domain-containing protein n=1 Tax=Ophiocordyceps australis TaxID=1399860 RepID=A0A2C5XEM1_9HYPO|nr:hypothetical protein CDD82_7626 [Ophiocordyceps australis]
MLSMSDKVHLPPSTQNVVFKTRYPSACKECRRRKQKCSLTQPCTNCARRFPQPVCEYGVDKAKRSSHAPTSDARNHGSRANGLYSHLDMDTVHDALLDLEGRPETATTLGATPTPTTPTTVELPRATLHHSPSDGQTNRIPNRYFLMHGQNADSQQLLRLRFRDKTGVLQGHDIIELLQYILKTRLKVTNSIIRDEWEIDGSHLLRASQEATPPGSSVSRFDDEVRYLPMAPTQMNKELVRTHLQLMSRFKASLDGSPRPNNRFMKNWIPFSIQDPLVLHVVLCSTASFLNETGRVPKVMLLMHRDTVTRMLNEHISDPQRCVDDSAMLAVAQLILTSWYWGSTQELHAHMAGFKRMIEMRGGIQNLGMEGYTSKVALIDDFVIALAHETEPMLFGVPGFDFVDPFRVPLQVCFNSPLLFDCPPFLSHASAPLRLHDHTAQILDAMRTIIKLIVDLPDDETQEQLEMVHRTALTVLATIRQVPEDLLMDMDRMTPQEQRQQQQQQAAEPLASGGAGARKRKRQDDDMAGPRKAGTHGDTGTRLATLSDADNLQGPPDLIHRCVRTTALVYCAAILRRVPTSQAVTETDFGRVWVWAWGAGLERWSALSGIFAWMMIGLAASTHQTVHGRMIKTLMVTCFMFVGTENWHVAADMATAALKLQRWLRGGGQDAETQNGAVSGAFGGESVVERLGFAFKDAVPDVMPQACEDDGSEEEGADIVAAGF